MHKTNENWVPCEVCGAPRLQIDGQSSPEPCSACVSGSNPRVKYLGSFAIGLILFAIFGLIAGSVTLLL